MVHVEEYEETARSVPPWEAGTRYGTDFGNFFLKFEGYAGDSSTRSAAMNGRGKWVETVFSCGVSSIPNVEG